MSVIIATNSNSDFICTFLCLQLAVTDANELYVWGASPQVLRLQAQAQKKTRVLEQRDANEKKSKAVGESEKIAGSATNPNEEIKEAFLMDDVQIESARTEAITSDIVSQKRIETENANLKDLNFDSIEESQVHLKPCVVDTSLVKGQINQVRNMTSLIFIHCAYNSNVVIFTFTNVFT